MYSLDYIINYCEKKDENENEKYVTYIRHK